MLRREAILSVILLSVVAAPGCDNRAVHTPVTWATVPKGDFLMGTPQSEACREPGQFKETLHKVTLSRPFKMMVTEVTQGQFKEHMGYNPSQQYHCGPDCPVDMVSWHEAAAFCTKAGTADGLEPCYTCSGSGREVVCEEVHAYRGTSLPLCKGMRLPTEAEWERACRAGTTSALFNGPMLSCDGLDGNASCIAWYSANSGMVLHEAATKQANAWGLYDMSGSVWEWVNDWYQPNLGTQHAYDPTGPASSDLGKVLRGGSAEVSARFVRSGSRYNYGPPAQQLRMHGFRCVVTGQ